MPARFKFENFGAVKKSPEPVAQDLEATLVSSYEHGYKAGWDDAIATQSKDRAAISADFARSLQEISFTYHEVREHLVPAFEALLRDVVARVLPMTAAATLGQTIIETLRPMTAAAADVPVELVVNSGNREKIAQLLKCELTLPVTVVEEDTLGLGQAFVRLGPAEKSIDMEEVLDAVSAAIDAYFAQDPEELRHAG
jgi:flagellar assembly protein FliH